MEKEEAKIENELSNIGETALIKKITKSFKLSNKSSILGIGDDAALINFDQKDVKKIYLKNQNYVLWAIKYIAKKKK